MKKLAVVVGLLMVGVLGGTLLAKEKDKDKPRKEIVQQTVADLQWKEIGPGMPMISEVWKAPGGAHCAFNRFAKGTSVPTHWHTKDIHTIVIAGNWGSFSEGAPEKLVAPGGYQLIPGGLKHSTRCGDAADCVIYECSPGAFDLKGLPPPPK